MRRIFTAVLMSAGLLAVTAAGSPANAWSERDRGGYSHGGWHGHQGYGYRGHYGSRYYAPSYGYRAYAPQWHHRRHHAYPPYGYYRYGW